MRKSIGLILFYGKLDVEAGNMMSTAKVIPEKDANGWG